MVDIYNKIPTDQNYKAQVETIDEVEQILSQIKMVLGTHKGDILGEPMFGVDINQYLFSMNYNQEEINEIIQTSVLLNISYDESKYKVELQVDFGKDAVNASDYACISVSINEIRRLGIIINQ